LHDVDREVNVDVSSGVHHFATTASTFNEPFSAIPVQDGPTYKWMQPEERLGKASSISKSIIAMFKSSFSCLTQG